MCVVCSETLLSASKVHSSVRDRIELTCSFWDLILKRYMNAVPFVIERDDFCFEFLDDDTSGIVPHYQGNRLMKDEYIDGEISRDVCRTFPHHFLFRHKVIPSPGPGYGTDFIIYLSGFFGNCAQHL